MSGKSTTGRSKVLGELLGGAVLQVSTALNEVHVTGITSDSRMIQEGNLFTAIKGLSVDGHDYIDAAIDHGCSSVVVENGMLTDMQLKQYGQRIPVVQVQDSQESVGYMAAMFYDHPAEQMTMIGITGSNGKTTTSFLIESIIKAKGGSPGVIGTVNYRYTNSSGMVIEKVAPYTTPEPPTLHHLLREMADARVTHVIMEVSSHALVQKRINGLFFDIAVFTNLSHEHLDFHGNMQKYFEGKKHLFNQYLKEHGTTIVQIEPQVDQQTDSSLKPWGRILAAEIADNISRKNTKTHTITCGIEEGSTIFSTSLAMNLDGITATIETSTDAVNISSSLTGVFNLKNILSAVSIAVALGIDNRAISKGISTLNFVPGRLERVVSEGNGPAVFVDYAHTPDALQNVLQTLNQSGSEKIICVLGCGGDRDQDKRPLMGGIAGKFANITIISNDNPRSESARVILEQIEEGISSSVNKVNSDDPFPAKGYMIIESRQQAIRTAILLAESNDIVLISGKGHEDYQIVGNKRSYFDDRIEATTALQMKNKGINLHTCNSDDCMESV